MFLHKYFHPLSGKLIFWNVILLVFIKLVLPQSAFQLAIFVSSVPVFDSREVIRLTNEARSVNKLAPLQANSQLDIAAEEKLNDMAIKEYFAHISPAGTTPWFWIQQAQYKYKVAGENLAIGFTTSQDIVKAWLNSPSHKANILNSQYQDIGVAVKGVKIGETTGVLVVQMFGLPAQVGKPSVQVSLAGSNPSPSPAPLISPALSPAVISGQTKGEIIAEPEITVNPSIYLQYVSTDTEIPAVTEPMRVQFKDAENTVKWTAILNNTFAIYSLFLAILSIISFIVFEKSCLPAQAGHTALKTSLHAAIFILAALVPSVGITLKALIF